MELWKIRLDPGGQKKPPIPQTEKIETAQLLFRPNIFIFDTIKLLGSDCFIEKAISVLQITLDNNIFV